MKKIVFILVISMFSFACNDNHTSIGSGVVISQEKNVNGVIIALHVDTTNDQVADIRTYVGPGARNDSFSKGDTVSLVTRNSGVYASPVLK